MKTMTKPNFVIKCKTGEYFHPRKQIFVHHSKGHRYGTRAMAQKSLNAALAKNPALSELNPEIEKLCDLPCQ
jgi:hypothetical protein